MAKYLLLPIIKTNNDLQDAQARLGETSDQDEQSAIRDLIKAYQKRSHEQQFNQHSTPVEIIEYLMEWHGLTQSDIPEIGPQSVVSDILNGKRSINARMAKALSQRFQLPIDAFLRK